MFYPNFSFENELWKKGHKFVGGVDEVGRGCLAGPVVAGCVVFKKGSSTPNLVRIDDSKKLRPGQRVLADKWIKTHAITYGLGSASVSEINQKGMSKATKTAFRRAIYSANARLGKRIDFLLIDAFYIPYVNGVRSINKKLKKAGKYDNRSRQLAIINGDERSISISAASIIAKVYRDKLMQKLGEGFKYKKYAWGRNKGYGTKEHQKAIKRYGITPEHRKKFVENFL
jgi:ribonuclease HII